MHSPKEPVMFRACLALILTLTAAACGAKQFDSLCAAVPTPAGCGKACDPAPGAGSTCDPGYHCSADGACDLQCTVGGNQCGDDYVCTGDGRCIPKGENPMNGPDASCPAVNFSPMPTTPSIQLLLDRSGSMNDLISGVTRYNALRNALTNTTNGVITALQNKAYFGASLYSSDSPCPKLYSVPRVKDNRNAIDALIGSQNPGGQTPTAGSIDQVVADFAANPAPAGSTPVIVLASDGLPNSCNGTNGETASIQAARNAYTAGIPLFILGVGTGINDGHLQAMANAGAGVQAGQPNAPFYLANTAQQLQQAFDTIIKGVISCDLALTDSIDPAQAMNGTVVVNGMTLTYGTDWVLVNGNMIRVLGAACTSLKTAPNPMVSAQFPCGSVIL
jgi:hypothetical protein